MVPGVTKGGVMLDRLLFGWTGFAVMVLAVALVVGILFEVARHT